MSSPASTKAHLDDIDFRNHAERQKAWKQDFIAWYKQLSKYRKEHGVDNERIEGQITMLSSVLWYLLDPKEYKALVRGRIYIDQDKLNAEQKRLFTSMMAFQGSPYCNASTALTVYQSYSNRAKPYYRPLLLKRENASLVHNICLNIAAKHKETLI